MAVVVCIAGLFVLYIIPVSPFPSSSLNQINVKLIYPGASAQTVQQQVTDKVVNALQSVENIQQISAYSRFSESDISIKLNSIKNNNMLQAQLNISRAISSSHLPTSVSPPKIDAVGQISGLVNYVVSSDKLSAFQINNFIKRYLYPKFNSLPQVTVLMNQNDSVVKIEIIPEKIAQYHLDPVAVSQRIDNSYQASPLGKMYVSDQSYNLSLQGSIHNLSQFKKLIVGYTKGSNGQPIFLKDIAHIRFEPREPVATSFSSFNGKKSHRLALVTDGNANPFSVSKITHQYVNKVAQLLPRGSTITSMFDTAQDMHAAISEVILTIAISSLLVLLIALVFLGRLRTTLIPIVTIPICLLGTMMFIQLLGFSINLVTLLAMVIAVGLVVDDAIVVIENITRYIEQGEVKRQAVIKGTASIAITVIGITSTLLAAYIPIAFCGGQLSAIIQSFAFTLASAVFISGIVALTLTPVMAIGLVVDKEPSRYQLNFEKLLGIVLSIYQRMLKIILRHPYKSLLLVVSFIIVASYASLHLPKSAFAKDPSGVIMIMLDGDAHSTVASLQKKSLKFKSFLKRPFVKYYDFSINKDPVSGRLAGCLKLQSKKEYLSRSMSFADSVNQYIKQHHIKNAYANFGKVASVGGDFDVTFELYGGKDEQQLNSIAQVITAAMKKSPLFSTVNNSIELPSKQIIFNIDKVAAAKYGIYRDDIAQLLSNYYGGYTLNNNMTIDGLSVPIVVQLDNKDLKNTLAIEKLQIKSPLDGSFHPLHQFIAPQLVTRPTVIKSFNNLPAVAINANLAKGYSLSQAIPYLNHLLSQKASMLQYQYQDNAQQYLENNHLTLFVIALGILCVYFILSILFKSAIDPFIIMLTVPFSIVGGAVSLFVVDGSLNVFSALGLMTLIGLITKHGVLIVQFANQELRKGVTAMQAVITAVHHRFRPIMMTTLAMTLGAIPLMIGHGLMYVSKNNLGIVIIGGLLVGTFFSLFIVPLTYCLLKQWRRGS